MHSTECRCSFNNAAVIVYFMASLRGLLAFVGRTKLMSMLFPFSSRMMEIQSKMAERALELLGLADGEVSFLLDVG